MNREYHKWYSPRLQRDMELLIFGHAGAKVLMFPTRAGRFYDYENMGIVEVLRPKVEQGYLQLYCLDSIDAESLYCFWARPADRIQRHLQYESYILHEVFPLMRQKNAHSCVISQGCSLGGYHAVNIAFRHPHLFQKVVGLSGRYDLTTPVEHFRDLFDGYYDNYIYFNMPSHFIPNLGDEHILQQIRRLDIVLTIGQNDPFRDNNQQFSQALWDKGIWHAMHIWQGRAHGVRAWRKMVELYV